MNKTTSRVIRGAGAGFLLVSAAVKGLKVLNGKCRNRAFGSVVSLTSGILGSLLAADVIKEESYNKDGE